MKAKPNYRYVKLRNHPRAAKSNGAVRVHLLVAEAALGHRLPPKSVVHHVNEDCRDNRNANLVICQDQAYHLLLHVRARVVRAGGNPNTQRLCRGCGHVKAFDAFIKGRRNKNGDVERGFRCYDCFNAHRRPLRRKAA